jgi:hypothetical protein
LKPEWWGSPLAQEEKYQGRKNLVTRDNNNNNNNKGLKYGLSIATNKTSLK